MTPPPPPDSGTTPQFFARDLALYGDRVAIVTADGELSYRDLAARVATSARLLGGGRRLVLVAGGNSVEAVVAYLGALAAGHPVLLAPGDNPASVDSLTATYDPDVVVGSVNGRWTYQQRREGSAHVLHPDLALLLSTSGSTGSPKLVRLSYRNLQSNAESIATYLAIQNTDRAATTLPMHYCYGLSVINSHLVRGAGLILTDLSVADTCFWDLFRAARGTSFAGVPYTFTLLDRIGFDGMHLPHLRYITQAGGRLAPERVRHHAALGRRRGWQFFVMYGQTEATARMAYLPPEYAESHPSAVGVPVPDGSLRLEPLPGTDASAAATANATATATATNPQMTGELVYAGPNVMLGYAECPTDLTLGRTVDELRTGDVARLTADGFFEIVGRRSRFAKVFGLRIDLQRVEAGLEADGVRACCVGGDDELVVVVEAVDHREHLPGLVAARCALPSRSVRVCVVAELPRLSSGKPDLRAVTEIAARPAAEPLPVPPTDLAALYAAVLNRSDVTADSTFVSLGGDSLSYVEVSLRLEQTLGSLPPGWHTMAIRELAAIAPKPARRRRTVDTGVALRAVSIVLIVGTHIGVFTVRGGAHLLLAVAGFNFARFHLTDATRRVRTRHVLTSVARIALPSILFIALLVLIDRDYSWTNALLLNEAIGPRTGEQRNFWFVETLVYTLLVLAVVVALPMLDRWERRLPFALPMVLLAAALTVRYDLIALSPADNLTTPAALFWLFALGWAAGKADRTWQRALVTVITVVTVSGYFTSALRSAVVMVGLMLLVWLPHLPGTALVNRLVGVLAGSSLYIYLTHWAVYPLFVDYSGVLALLASLAAGVLYATATDWATALLPLRRRRAAATARRSPSGRHTPVGAARSPLTERRRSTRRDRTSRSTVGSRRAGAKVSRGQGEPGPR